MSNRVTMQGDARRCPLRSGGAGAFVTGREVDRRSLQKGAEDGSSDRSAIARWLESPSDGMVPEVS